MILQSLDKYYQRLLEKPESLIPKYGFGDRDVSGAICIDTKGNVIEPFIKDIRIDGKRPVKRPVTVPVWSSKRTSGIMPFFLWDKTDYLLGFSLKNNELVLTQKHFEKSKELHQKLLKSIEGVEASAIISFFDKWNPQDVHKMQIWEKFSGEFLVFQIIEGSNREFVHENKLMQTCWSNHVKNNTNSEGYVSTCLITGKKDFISLLHPPIKGIQADKAELGIVAINKDKTAFCSYDKVQGYNSPIGKTATFNYVTALNFMLKRGSKQKIQIGDATTVFWSERENPIEGIFGMAIDPKDAELSDNVELKDFLQAVREGEKLPYIDKSIDFYVLGLSPNGPRISIRFWHVSNVADISTKIGQHFKDMQIVKQFENEIEFPGIRRLLWETVNQKATDKTPQPLLAGAVLWSILEGTVYPQALQSAIINRIRAECSLKDKNGKPINNINYVRTAILKAILVRKHRLYKQGMEVSMALDKENNNPAYLLGRLFAVLEKVQQDALGKNINATIKDRFFGSASATPKAVFPQLLRLAQHHIEKAEYGKARDKQIEEILCEIQDFPAHLTLDEQGLFVIGYYHQRQSFYPTKIEQQ